MQHFPSETKRINLGTVRGTANSWAAELLLAELLLAELPQFVHVQVTGVTSTEKKKSVTTALKEWCGTSVSGLFLPSNWTKQPSDTLGVHSNVVSKKKQDTQKHFLQGHSRTNPLLCSGSPFFPKSYGINQSRTSEEHVWATATTGETQPPQCDTRETGSPTSGKRSGEWPSF